MAYSQERFRPVVVGVNTTTLLNSNALSGFLCKTSGTITASYASGTRVVIDNFPVTAGQYYPLPFLLSHNGGTFITAGGASGTLGVG